MNLDERLMSFFEGGMSEDDKVELRQDLSNDEDLMEQFKSYQLMYEVKDELFIKNWREKMDEWPVPAPIERSITIKKILMVASFLLPILGISYFISSNYSTSNLEQIYSDIQDFEIISRSPILDTEALELITLNKAGKYTEAIERSSACNTALCLLHKGIALRHNNNYDQSLKTLSTLPEKSEVSNRVQWEILLNHLARKDKKQARKQAKVIIENSKSPYKTKAQSILDQLD